MLQLRQRSIALLLAAFGCALGACDGGPKTYEVSGVVSYDGQPVEKGQISFVPGDGGAPDAGIITDGKYTVSVTPGAKRVEIRASRPLPPERQTNPDMGLMYEDFIPATYNSASTLKADVSSSNRTFDYQLVPPN